MAPVTRLRIAELPGRGVTSSIFRHGVHNEFVARRGLATVSHPVKQANTSVTSTSTSTSGNRSIHSSAKRSLKPSPTSENALTILPTSAAVAPQDSAMPNINAPLSLLPLRMILRSLMTTTVSSSPLLLPPSLRLMDILAHSQNPVFNPDRNPLLRWVVKKTFYSQFCAGENPAEVTATINRLKDIGFTGVIMGYAKEVVLNKNEMKGLAACVEDGKAAEECVQNEVTPWAEGTMQTVRMAQQGDIVALKFTGAGRQALHALSERLPPPPALANAIDNICALAAEQGVRLFFDAEQAALQNGIDDWTLHFMRKYNKITDENSTGEAVIYGTYQAYLKSCPATLASHLAQAQEEGFMLGVKLVRGAYLGSDPRHLIHDTKADTDACYDGVAEALLRREWNDTLQSSSAPDAEFPRASLVLACHNAESVRKAKSIWDAGEAKIHVAFGQLQGMADEISCELVCTKKMGETAAAAAAMAAASSEAGGLTSADVALRIARGEENRAMSEMGHGVQAKSKKALETYKYLVWGSTGECMKYLLRRAYENRDAVSRTRAGRDAMWAELVRRTKTALGFSS